MAIKMETVSQEAKKLISEENGLFETVIQRTEGVIDRHLMNFAKGASIEFPLIELSMFAESIRPKIIQKLIQDYTQSNWNVNSIQKGNMIYLIFSGHLDGFRTLPRFNVPITSNEGTFVSIPENNA